jgi:DNA-binding transcriptional ArsR family regulator
MICYTPRGTGLWWRKPDTTAIHSLELTIGEARAHILQSLEIPASTGEVAHALRVTSGAVSQHLSLLNKAGLVENRRSGKRVYYSLTERGEELLKLFS